MCLLGCAILINGQVSIFEKTDVRLTCYEPVASLTKNCIVGDGLHQSDTPNIIIAGDAIQKTQVEPIIWRLECLVNVETPSQGKVEPVVAAT